jgi:hypothetical protein
MHENVGAAAIGRDEAISAICVEEFDASQSALVLFPHNGCGPDLLTGLARATEPLRRQLAAEKVDTRKVAARLSKAGDETEPDGVVASDEDDRNRGR